MNPQHNPNLGTLAASVREHFVAWGAAGARVIVAPDRDVDGLSAGVLTVRALERLGATPLVELPGKGEHVHSAPTRARLQALRADGLVVLDMGSRRGPIVEGLPTTPRSTRDPRWRAVRQWRGLRSGSVR